MGYKVPTDTLEGILIQLEANNKHLLKAKIKTPAIKTLINGNIKQIAVIKEAAPILGDNE
jgi:hypothetical protein